MLSPIFDLPDEMNVAIAQQLADDSLPSFAQLNRKACALARELAFKKIAACYPELVKKYQLTPEHPKVIAILLKENKARAEICFGNFTKEVPDVGYRYLYAGAEYELDVFLKKCAKKVQPESKRILQAVVAKATPETLQTLFSLLKTALVTEDDYYAFIRAQINIFAEEEASVALFETLFKGDKRFSEEINKQFLHYAAEMLLRKLKEKMGSKENNGDKLSPAKAKLIRRLLNIVFDSDLKDSDKLSIGFFDNLFQHQFSSVREQQYTIGAVLKILSATTRWDLKTITHYAFVSAARQGDVYWVQQLLPAIDSAWNCQENSHYNWLGRLKTGVETTPCHPVENAAIAAIESKQSAVLKILIPYIKHHDNIRSIWLDLLLKSRAQFPAGYALLKNERTPWEIIRNDCLKPLIQVFSLSALFGLVLKPFMPRSGIRWPLAGLMATGIWRAYLFEKQLHQNKASPSCPLVNDYFRYRNLQNQKKLSTTANLPKCYAELDARVAVEICLLAQQNSYYRLLKPFLPDQARIQAVDAYLRTTQQQVQNQTYFGKKGAALPDLNIDKAQVSDVLQVLARQYHPSYSAKISYQAIALIDSCYSLACIPRL